MKTFRTSPTARILSLVVTSALMGGGLIARWAEQPYHLMPLLLVLCVTTSVVALITGLNDHLGAVLLATGLLTIALLPYSMVLGLAMRDSKYAELLFAAGIVPLAFWAGTWLRTTRTATQPVETQKPQQFADRTVTAGSSSA